MSNLHGCVESYIGYVKNLLSGWRLNAKSYLGCQGFLVVRYNDSKNGYLTYFGRSFPWMSWAGGAGWNIRPLYEYATLTGNETFLKEHVFPLYREMASFYEDYFIMGYDSLYHICPSILPENASPGADTRLDKDATMDVTIAREVLGLFLEIGYRLRVNRKKLEWWSHYLQRLPAYRINNDGALAEWVDPRCPDVYNRRHFSHLHPVFPGSRLGKSKGDFRFIRATGVALDKHFVFGTGLARGLVHVVLQAARLGDIEKVKTNLDRFCRRHYLCDGLVISHDPEHQVYSLDVVLSFPRLLTEMLVYTEKGKTELLSAWPHKCADGYIKEIQMHGGHTLDITWKSEQLVEVTLYVRRNESYEAIYGDRRARLQLRKGKTYYFPAQFFVEK